MSNLWIYLKCVESADPQKMNLQKVLLSWASVIAVQLHIPHKEQCSPELHRELHREEQGTLSFAVSPLTTVFRRLKKKNHNLVKTSGVDL